MAGGSLSAPDGSQLSPALSPAPHGSLVSRKERKRPVLLTCEFQVVHCNAGRPLSSTGGVLQNPGARQPGGGTLGSVPLSSCGGRPYSGLGQVAEGEAKSRPVTGARTLGGGALSGAPPDLSLVNISTVAFSRLIFEGICDPPPAQHGYDRDPHNSLTKPLTGDPRWHWDHPQQSCMGGHIACSPPSCSSHIHTQRALSFLSVLLLPGGKNNPPPSSGGIHAGPGTGPCTGVSLLPRLTVELGPRRRGLVTSSPILAQAPGFPGHSYDYISPPSTKPKARLTGTHCQAEK